MTFIKFQDMRNEQENVLASSVGQQMKQIGEAVNGYINIRYDKLSTLSNAAGNGTDPGPRTCSATVCEITYQTLVNEGLLPSSFNGYNVIRSPYKIILKRDGMSPNYVINGLITTASSWMVNGNVRYDLLGKAMQVAGIDSGITKTATDVSGFNGQWSESSSSFSNITSSGQLAFRVGFNSSLYTLYLRRDGTLPMSGDLNMGGNNINHVKDITSSGIISTGSLKTLGAVSVGKDFIVSGQSTMAGNVSMKNTLSVDGVSILKGDVIAKNNITASGDITNKGKIAASGNIISSSDIYSNGRLTTNEYLQINGKAIAGSSCSSNGLVGISSDGKMLSCYEGKWKSADSSGSIGFFAPAYRNSNGLYFQAGCAIPNIHTRSCSCLPEEIAVGVLIDFKHTPQGHFFSKKRVYLCLKSTTGGGHFY
ncbi:shufflon system plasmid conjugative transfer pilus tip adhesin PilV [Salmonella enterica subsp. diarizonae]|nr:shufflon system plasmid conjugative transfer pilus tip adhesin PilV [Salmonella enterica subsp. diarizonae]